MYSSWIWQEQLLSGHCSYSMQAVLAIAIVYLLFAVARVQLEAAWNNGVCGSGGL